MQGSPWKVSMTLKIVLILFVGLTIIGAWQVNRYSHATPYAVYVDGEPVVTLRSKGVAEAVLKTLRSRFANGLPSSCVRFKQTVRLQPAPQGVRISKPTEAVKKLGEMLCPEVWAFAIVVDDMPVIGLRSNEEAEQALEILKKSFAEKIDKLSGQPTFKEKVVIHRQYVTPDRIAPDPKTAAKVLMAPAGERQYYTVRLGDRAVNIALQFGLTLDQLKKLNPKINLDKIREGDRLLVKLPKPPITVVTKRLVTKVTEVSGPAELKHKKKLGKRHTTAVIIYENDTPVGEEVISQVTVWENSTSTLGRGSSGQTRGHERY